MFISRPVLFSACHLHCSAACTILHGSRWSADDAACATTADSLPATPEPAASVPAAAPAPIAPPTGVLPLSPANCYFLPEDEMAEMRARAEDVVATFAKDFRQFWDAVSANAASVDMVNACLQGAYSLGISQPQYRVWLPLAKIGETVAILHIMRCNLCLDGGDLAQALCDAQAAVALSTVPGAPQSSPKATSGMWFAQACRALGRVAVVRSPHGSCFAGCVAA